MKWIEKLAKRVTKTASETVTTSAKSKAKNTIPIILGLGIGVWGVISFFKDSKTDIPIPDTSFLTKATVTNNYYFNVSYEELLKIAKEVR